jgi:hypothetical protein
MAITYVGTANNPSDSTTYGVIGAGLPTALAVTPPSMNAGDLMLLTGYAAQSSASRFFSMHATGGQTWNVGGAHSGLTGGGYFWWWGTFNGSWSANPALIYSASGTAAMIVNLTVFRPTASSNTWSIDVPVQSTESAAPGSPFDVTLTGQTPTRESTVTVARWMAFDDNTWALQTGGWTNPGGQTQWRSHYDTQGSLALAYKIQTSIAATGDVTNRQSAADAYWKSIVTFAETAQPVNAARHPLMNPIYRM